MISIVMLVARRDLTNAHHGTFALSVVYQTSILSIFFSVNAVPTKVKYGPISRMFSKAKTQRPHLQHKFWCVCGRGPKGGIPSSLNRIKVNFKSPHHSQHNLGRCWWLSSYARIRVKLHVKQTINWWCHELFKMRASLCVFKEPSPPSVWGSDMIDSKNV